MVAFTDSPTEAVIENGTRPSIRSGTAAPMTPESGARPSIRSGTAAPTTIESGARPSIRSGTAAPVRPSVGVTIPGAFGRVAIQCVNEDGEPLGNLRWIMSAGSFPTAAPVDAQGRANLWLLGTGYTRFVGIAEAGDAEIAFYSSAAQEPINPLNSGSATVIFRETEIEAGSAGLSIGGGR